MSAQPMFKPRVGYGWQGQCNWSVGSIKQPGDTHRVRVTDARDLTPEQAVEKVLQTLCNVGANHSWLVHAATKAGMSARVVNGKVRVRREKT